MTNIRRSIIAACAIAAVCAAVPGAFAASDRKGIYGKDDRVDVVNVTNSTIKKLTESTVAFFKASDVDSSGKLTLQPFKSSLHETYQLCNDVKFYNQSIGAFCSGSLIGEDMVMTAGHCVTSAEQCAETKIVFGFGIRQAGGNTPASVPAGEVYSCKSIVTQTLDESTLADYAVIRLDRKVTGHKPLAVESGAMNKSDKVFVIGHPSGLATKVAANGKVRDDSNPNFYVTNLDTYGGNSGSPVFSQSSFKIIGILVRGGTDYVLKDNSNPQCITNYVTGENSGRGEDVTKSSVVVKAVKDALAKEKTVTEAAAAKQPQPKKVNVQAVKDAGAALGQ